MQRMELWHNPENKSQDMLQTISIVKEIGKNYLIKVTLVDARTKSVDEIKKNYKKLIESLIKPGYSISYSLRGAPKDYDFGIKRPMLIIYDNEIIIDVYPHQELIQTIIPKNNLKGKVKRTISIYDYLEKFQKEDKL